MTTITIHRGANQIGGICAEICSGSERLLIDLGANLPDTDSKIDDRQLISKVFGGRETSALFFTHPHGDHYGLYKKIPDNVPVYIGETAKEVLKVLVKRLDTVLGGKGLRAVEKMRTYTPAEKSGALKNISVTPFYVDHSAPDSYMFLIKADGKNILYTGDFRDHGILAENGRLWRTLDKYMSEEIDVLITEGTMLSRRQENNELTESDLGNMAKELFARKKYNFILVSSTNADSLMEFYHNTPADKDFVCDAYQAEIMLTVMRGIRRKGNFPMYNRCEDHKTLYIIGKFGYEELNRLQYLGAPLGIEIEHISSQRLYERGFVMPARKNLTPPKKNIFEIMRDKFYPLGGQIIYSMWDGYLKGEHKDRGLINFIGGRDYVSLHTSGHAYPHTIAKLIDAVNPKVIIPMHTESAGEFTADPALSKYKNRIRFLNDGEIFELN